MSELSARGSEYGHDNRERRTGAEIIELEAVRERKKGVSALDALLTPDVSRPTDATAHAGDFLNSIEMDRLLFWLRGGRPKQNDSGVQKHFQEIGQGLCKKYERHGSHENLTDSELVALCYPMKQMGGYHWEYYPDIKDEEARALQDVGREQDVRDVEQIGARFYILHHIRELIGAYLEHNGKMLLSQTEPEISPQDMRDWVSQSFTWDDDAKTMKQDAHFNHRIHEFLEEQLLDRDGKAHTNQLELYKFLQDALQEYLLRAMKNA